MLPQDQMGIVTATSVVSDKDEASENRKELIQENTPRGNLISHPLCAIFYEILRYSSGNVPKAPGIPLPTPEWSLLSVSSPLTHMLVQIHTC